MNLFPKRLIFKLLNLRTGLGIQRRFPIIKSAKDFLFRTFKSKYVEVHGHTMYVGDDPLLLSWRETYEPESTKLVQQEIQLGNTVFDVGAHVGYYTLLFAKLVGPEGRVIAFEPHPRTFAILEGNVARNAYRNVHLVRAALSNESTTAKLYLSDLQSGKHTLLATDQEKYIWIETRQADSQDYPVPDFVKIDVEGSELLVLQGMKKLLGRNPNIKLLVEYDSDLQKKTTGTETALLDFLEENNFTYEQRDKNLFCRRRL